jgi:hypothetical protein
VSVFWGWDVRDTDTGGRVLLMRGVEYWVWVGGQVVVNFFFFFFCWWSLLRPGNSICGVEQAVLFYIWLTFLFSWVRRLLYSLCGRCLTRPQVGQTRDASNLRRADYIIIIVIVIFFGPAVCAVRFKRGAG